MNDNTATEQTDTTTVPCPDWCDLQRPEPFDIEDATGQPIRYHDRTSTRGDGFTVWFAVKERLTPVGLVVEGARIGIDQAGCFNGPDALTPTQARKVAAALLQAADEADRIVGA